MIEIEFTCQVWEMTMKHPSVFKYDCLETQRFGMVMSDLLMIMEAGKHWSAETRSSEHHSCMVKILWNPFWFLWAKLCEQQAHAPQDRGSQIQAVFWSFTSCFFGLWLCMYWDFGSPHRLAVLGTTTWNSSVWTSVYLLFGGSMSSGNTSSSSSISSICISKRPWRVFLTSSSLDPEATCKSCKFCIFEGRNRLGFWFINTVPLRICP